MKIRSVLVLLLTALAIQASALTSIQHQSGQQPITYQWDVTDIQFQVPKRPESPTDLQFEASFKGPDGEKIQLPGFYNGNKQFVVRFTADSPGAWTYSTESSFASLNGLQGTLRVMKARKGRKGGIVINPKTPRRFHYQNGDSYYPIAFESDWLFALDAENPDDIPVTRKFIDQLASSGFNQIVMNVFAYDVNWKKDQGLKPEHEYGSPRVFPFNGDNTKPDHSQLNIDYFKRFDRVIACLDEKGIAAHLMFYVWNKKVSWPKADSQEDNRYFDYVAKRYQAFPNIIWDISKEALGYGHTDVNYITKRIERLRKIDQYKRLITVHDYSYCRRFTDKIDFVSVQLWSSELYSVMRKVLTDMPGKPILNIEHGGYERSPYVVFTGDYTSPEVCLERAYQCVFAGTFPTHYWQGAAWNVIIPDIEAMEPSTKPRLDYYRHMQTLVERYEIAGLIAGQKKSTSGYCLQNGKDLFIYYVPKENEHIGVRMPKDAKGRKMSGTWFNPFTGKFDKPKIQTISQWPSFSKPDGEGFRILIVEILPEN